MTETNKTGAKTVMSSPLPVGNQNPGPTGADNDDNDLECESALQMNENLINAESGDGENSQDTYNIIRLTKADLKKFPNFDSNKIPESLEETASFIEAFIEEKKMLIRGRKRKHDDQRTFSGVQKESEIILESLELKPEIEASFQTSSHDFKLKIFHSKGASLCEAQQFTKTLVSDTDGEKIVTDKLSSSLVYFFYRILETNKTPEIFMITVGQTWRLAKEVACDSFSSNVKARDLEKKAVHSKQLHVDGGDVLTTEQHARGGRRLNPELHDIPDRIEQKSTRYAKHDSTVNRHTAFKRGSRIHVSGTAIAFPLSLNIKEIHNFLKTISKSSQINRSKNLDTLQKVEDEQLIEQLDNQLLKRLTEKDTKGNYCSERCLQNEDTAKWNDTVQVNLLIPVPNNKDATTSIKQIPYYQPVYFRDVITELANRKIPEKDWLQKTEVKWAKQTEPLRDFLEDYVILEGVFHRYLFGQWYTVNYEYVAEKDIQFKQVLSQNFLKASKDFPILPWIHTSKKEDEKSASSQTQKAKKSLRKDSAKGISQTQVIQQSPSTRQAVTPFASASKSKSSQTPMAKKTAKKTDDTPDSSQSPACQPSTSASCTQADTPSAAAGQVSEYIVDLGVICKSSKSKDGCQNFKTETLEINSKHELFHNPIEVIHFDQIVQGGKQIEGSGKALKASYSVYRRPRVSKTSYTVPVNDMCQSDELARLLFLRLNTQMPESDYNDCHMILRRLLKFYQLNRFIIIPGDELFVDGKKNNELYDILMSDEENKITYVIHVKSGFGQSTRIACDQLRLSAQAIRSSLLYKSSTSILEQYWNNNSRSAKDGYRQETAKVLSDINKENFLKLFTDTDRKLVFVYACRDDRKVGLQQEAESGTVMDKNAETPIRKALREECNISESHVKRIINTLKEKQILASNGQINDKYMFQKVKESERSINQSVKSLTPPFFREKAVNAITSILKDMKSDSDSTIAKWNLINLWNEFYDYRVGDKEFELKVCHIPMRLYLFDDDEEEEFDDDEEEEDRPDQMVEDDQKSAPKAPKAKITDYFKRSSKC